MSAEVLPDAGPCRQPGCGDGQWSHKRGRSGCKEVGCGCDKYLPPVDAVLPCGTESARRRHLARGEECAVCDPSLAQVEAEPEPVDEAEPEPAAVVADPVAQSESLRQVAEVDAQLADPEPLPGSVPVTEAEARDLLAARAEAAERERDRARRELAEERREHQATALLLAEQRHIAGRIAEQQRETLRELGRERAEHRDTVQELAEAQERVDELEAHVTRLLTHMGPVDPARVLISYDADQCLRCGFRTTVPGLLHHHPMQAVTVLVVQRPTAEADAEATNPTKE